MAIYYENYPIGNAKSLAVMVKTSGIGEIIEEKYLLCKPIEARAFAKSLRETNLSVALKTVFGIASPFASIIGAWSSVAQQSFINKIVDESDSGKAYVRIWLYKSTRTSVMYNTVESTNETFCKIKLNDDSSVTQKVTYNMTF